MLLTCQNIKLSVQLEKDVDMHTLKRNHNCEVLEKRTCFLVRTERGVLTIYKHSPFVVHVTGIKSNQNLDNIIKFLTSKLKNTIKNIKIDNSMFSCKNHVKIDRNSLLTSEKENLLYTLKYVCEAFPAIYFKPKESLKKNGHPTILLFNTGSFVFLGGKKIEEIKSANVFIENIINKYKM